MTSLMQFAQLCENSFSRAGVTGNAHIGGQAQQSGDAGSGSGARQDPQWFRNLRAAAHAQMQIGATHMDAEVRVAENTERDMLWHQVIMAQDPRRRRYEQKASR